MDVKMEFPQSLEDHFYQVAKHLVDKTTAGVQELFRHHWKAIRGHSFWDVEVGNDLWGSCHTQLKPTSKRRTVKGQINKWNISDLAVLLPKLLQTNNNSSLAIPYSKILKNIQDLFVPFETENLFGSLVALSMEKFIRFKSALAPLLIQLDTDTMKLSNITRDVISVEDLTKAYADLMKINELRRVCVTIVIARITELIETYNLPPYFEEAMYKFRFNGRTGTPCNKIKATVECLKLVSFDRSNTLAHCQLAQVYYEDKGQNPSLHFYHSRKHRSLQPHRYQLFNFIKTFIEQNPTDPSCSQLLKGLQLMKIQNPLIASLEDHYLAMEHFRHALHLGNQLGLYAFAVAAILVKDLQYDPQLGRSEKDDASFQLGVKLLTKEVMKKPQYHKYNSCPSQHEKLGQAYFLLGYLYDKGFISRDYDKAKALYQTAVTVYNNEIASYYLGSLYYDGAGVRKSYMWAKLYWQHCITSTKREWPVYALLDYYLKHLAFTSAKMQAEYLGGVEPRTKYNEQVNRLNMRLKSFESKHAHVKAQLSELTCLIEMWEYKWKLSDKGLTFLDRLKRAEILGLKHKYGAAVKETYDFFELSYGTERSSEGEVRTMSAYVYGFDENLEVDYSQLFSRLHLVAPARIFSVTTFRHNLATNQQPKWDIKYKTQLQSELISKYPKVFQYCCPNDHFTVVEDVLFMKDAIYLIIECALTGIFHQLKVNSTDVVIRVDKNLKLENGATLTLCYKGDRGFGGNTNVYFDNVMEKIEVMLMGKVADMCRFCCEPIVKMKECVCGFRYCGEMCKEKDRKYLKHEFLCLPLP